jgi:uncharacterized protein (TIGR02466 family)
MGVFLHGLVDLDGSERELRVAVRLAPGATGAVEALAKLLAARGRPDEAVAVHQSLVTASAGHPLAEFGLARILLEVGRDIDAEAACRRGIARGLGGAEPWVFLGRVLYGQGRFDEAEHAFRAAVRRDPASPDAHRELAQLIWMRTGDIAQARAELDAALPSPALTSVTVRLLENAGKEVEACALAAERADRDPVLAVLAARAALRIDPQAAARRLAAAPASADPVALAKGWIEVDLALGRAAQAAARAEALHATRPHDHYATALLATAWRLAGDPRYGALHDYAHLVKTYWIAPPAGWSSLEAYLVELAGALDGVHASLTHPIGQSVRHGSQTIRDLTTYSHPAIRALLQAIDPPIRRHIADLEEAPPDYRILGAWSVRLNGGGSHIDHIHPEGWLSSAFYVRVPERLPDRQGWLRFGQPGPPTSPALAADHFVKPEPGVLVLFPSWMWHGTVPFTADETRLTCAFDLVRGP